jgi:hypothetical protein
MPKLKYSDILAANSLRKLGELDVPIKIAVKIKKVIREVRGPLESYDELFKKLQLKHVARKADGSVDHPLGPNGQPDPTRVSVPAENFAAYSADIKELQAQEVDITYDTFKIADLGDIRVPGGVLADLHWLVLE